MPAGFASHEVPRGGRSGLFPCPSRARHRPTAPGGSASSEYRRCQPPPAVFRPRRPTRVSCPHRDITSARPLHQRCRRWECVHSARDLPGPATFRPRAFSAPRRFAPRSGFAGLLHPATTSRACSCSGAWPPPAAESSSSEDPCPHAVARTTPDRPKPIAGVERPRLRGVAPLADSNDVRLPARSFIPSSGSVLLRACALPAMTRVTPSQPLLTLVSPASCLRTKTASLASSDLSPTASASSVSR